jgi:REP element-mobilizing transposase RayT
VGRQRYFLTMCTANRRTWFVTREAVDLVLFNFRSVGGSQGIAILAYCFMPDHVHFVVEALADTTDFREYVKLAKQHSGLEHRRATGEALWQTGYFDRVLRREESTDAVVRYVVGNPVRGGLVRCAVEWPFSGSDVFDLATL